MLVPYLRLTPLPGTVPSLVKGGVLAADGTVRAPLVDRPLLLGRGGHCDLVAASGRVAREDTVFEPSPEGWVARNLGRNQGMRVNGKPAQRALLHDGDVIFLFGVAFTFVDGDPEAAASPPG